MIDVEEIRAQFLVHAREINGCPLEDEVMRESLLEKLRGWLAK